MSTSKTRRCPVSLLYICLVSAEEICLVSTADICPVSTADICSVSTIDVCLWGYGPRVGRPTLFGKASLITHWNHYELAVMGHKL